VRPLPATLGGKTQRECLVWGLARNPSGWLPREKAQLRKKPTDCGLCRPALGENTAGMSCLGACGESQRVVVQGESPTPKEPPRIAAFAGRPWGKTRRESLFGGLRGIPAGGCPGRKPPPENPRRGFQGRGFIRR